MDEAYHHYIEDPAYRTALPLALENPQVVLARTFSKVYGLAGIRVGYAVGHADTLKAMSRFRIPNNVNVLAAAAAIAALPQTRTSRARWRSTARRGSSPAAPSRRPVTA